MRDLDQDVAAVDAIAAVPTILEVVCRTTGMGFAAVARVTEARWVACQVLDNIDFGLKPGGELKVETTICREIRENREPVVINHVSEDEAYCGHPTPAMYGFQSYISMPIVLRDGSFFGTLCAIDPRPARLKSPEVVGMFKLFAELIAVHIDANERLVSSEASLLGEREESELREQFIAVLGHDLRNPLASIDAGARMLLRGPLEDKAAGMVRLMQGSVRRMAGLIDNLLDLARNRLGSGLSLRRECKSLEPALVQVISELRSTHPDRAIEIRFDLDRAFDCDHARIAQLFSNLLVNAITHGATEAPIRVRAATTEGFELSVSNSGDPIPTATLDRLFQPFYRGQVRSSLQGLGLGLYIASQIAQAHGGSLSVASSAAETRFTLLIPEQIS